MQTELLPARGQVGTGQESHPGRSNHFKEVSKTTKDHGGGQRREGHSRQPGSTGVLEQTPKGGRIYTTEMGQCYI